MLAVYAAQQLSGEGIITGVGVGTHLRVQAAPASRTRKALGRVGAGLMKGPDLIFVSAQQFTDHIRGQRSVQH